MTEDEERKRRIEMRAYEIWLEEGQPSGRHKQHWERAKREITGNGGPRSEASLQPEPTGEAEHAPPTLVDQGEGQPPREAQDHEH
jgi:hypothetical protein